MTDIQGVNFDENGLVPAIVQDYYTKEVLTLAYMNRESLEISIREGQTCFYSRSRQKLWRKGEESGNTQKIVSIKSDCDNDALVIEVIKAGPACHTGDESCFNNTVHESGLKPQFSLNALSLLLQERRQNPPPGSYTSYLFEKGMDKILKKVGEECTEVVIAAKNSDKAETVFEIADLTYHAMVLMTHMGISVSEVADELASRHVVDVKVKQERMS